MEARSNRMATRRFGTIRSEAPNGRRGRDRMQPMEFSADYPPAATTNRIGTAERLLERFLSTEKN